MKKMFMIISLVLAMSLLIGLTPMDAKAQLPPVLWSDFGMIYVEIIPLGPFYFGTWSLMAHNYDDFSGAWGIGFTFFEPVSPGGLKTVPEFGYYVLGDDFPQTAWYNRASVGGWYGDGSQGATGIANPWLGQLIEIFSSAGPFPAASTSKGDFAATR